MRHPTPDQAVAVVLLASLSTVIDAAPRDTRPADPAEENRQQDTEQSDSLPGKITDPDIVQPPGDRISFSGAPAGWGNFIPDSKTYTFTILDRLEYGASDKGDSYLWDIQGWVGRDNNRFWWKTEGEGPTSDEPETAELQALYYRTISPFWGVQGGLRHDSRNSGSNIRYAVLAVQGLAPYWFETAAALFASEDGDLSFRGELEYDFLLTQRLKLQPRLEFNVSADDVPERGLASGLNNTEMGLRLRYEIRREFAPYVGVRWEQLYGDTEDIAERVGEPTSVTSVVFGFRVWF